MRAWWICFDCDSGGEGDDVAANDKAAERHVKLTGHSTSTHLSTACG